MYTIIARLTLTVYPAFVQACAELMILTCLLAVKSTPCCSKGESKCQNLAVVVQQQVMAILLKAGSKAAPCLCELMSEVLAVLCLSATPCRHCAC